MYQTTYQFLLVGLGGNVWTPAMKKAEPLERFVYSFKEVDELPDSIDSDTSVIILGPRAKVSAPEVRRRIGFGLRLICCVEDINALPPETLEVIDEIWPYNTNERTASFYFVRLIRNLKVEQEIAFLANSDALTGLVNRYHFYDYLEQNRGTQTLTIAHLCLSYFKQLNDTYGSRAGDEALMAMADFLREVFPEALLCRFGGGEFLIAFLGECSLDDLKARFRQVLDKLDEYCTTNKNPILLSANMGITTSGDPKQPLDSLLRQSDLALYFARNTDDGECKLFSEIVSAE